MLSKRKKRNKRHFRVKSKILKFNAKLPLLCVFRSNKHIYAQIIDQKGKTVISISDLKLKGKKQPQKEEKNKNIQKEKETNTRTGKAAIAFEVGKLVANLALQKKIEKAVFDRAGYKYHGRVKALAEGAKEGGLKL